MTLITATCTCSFEGCSCIDSEKEQWVDVLTNLCRRCEKDHAEGMLNRWGPKGRRAI